jgi:hypothetical protein
MPGERYRHPKRGDYEQNAVDVLAGPSKYTTPLFVDQQTIRMYHRTSAFIAKSATQTINTAIYKMPRGKPVFTLGVRQGNVARCAAITQCRLNLPGTGARRMHA